MCITFPPFQLPSLLISTFSLSTLLLSLSCSFPLSLSLLFPSLSPSLSSSVAFKNSPASSSLHLPHLSSQHKHLRYKKKLSCRSNYLLNLKSPLLLLPLPPPPPRVIISILVLTIISPSSLSYLTIKLTHSPGLRLPSPGLSQSPRNKCCRKLIKLPSVPP